jgi:hypothetical protein
VVEGAVVGVFQGDVSEAFIVGDGAVADDLDFGLVWDCFEVWVQDGAFGVESLAMAVAGGFGVEEAG